MRHSDTILIVDDDLAYADAVRAVLDQDFEVVAASSFAEAKKRLSNGFAAVLLDIRLSKTDASNQDGLLLLKNLKQTQPDIPVVMMTSYGDDEVAIEAMKLGASDFVQKGEVNYRDLGLTVRNAVDRTRWKQRAEELDQYIRRMQGWDNLVGDHPSMHEVRKLVDIVAQDGFTNVLISGETGTGKELVARAIHSRGRRKDKPFISVPITNWPRELVDAELFGHKKGAFTGAGESRTGYLAEADGGVLFLDEIGELASEIQVKLLRFLENRRFTRLGSTEEIPIDVQVVCATHRNLEEQIRKGTFREDLYYRLKTVEIALPALRERTEDIPLLADHFLSELRRQRGARVVGIARPAVDRLMTYSYPGNVRELKNLVDRATLLATARGDSMLQPADFPLQEQRPVANGSAAVPPPIQFGENGVDLDQELARVELVYVSEALRATEGKKTEAYRMLGLNDRFALRRRIKRIGEAYPRIIEDFPMVKKLYYD